MCNAIEIEQMKILGALQNENENENKNENKNEKGESDYRTKVNKHFKEVHIECTIE